MGDQPFHSFAAIMHKLHLRTACRVHFLHDRHGRALSGICVPAPPKTELSC
jgi:hypothetical protein